MKKAINQFTAPEHQASTGHGSEEQSRQGGLGRKAQGRPGDLPSSGPLLLETSVGAYKRNDESTVCEGRDEGKKGGRKTGERRGKKRTKVKERREGAKKGRSHIVTHRSFQRPSRASCQK